MEMNSNTLLYEINSRVWIKRFGENLKLHEIPIDYWQKLRSLGFDFIWLMGIWQTNHSSVEKYCFEEGLIKDYTAALPDWQKEDVIGSPYSIEDYIVSPILGGEDSLLKLREKLYSIGLKLILDFIPNHFNAESKLLITNPEIFLQGSEDNYKTEPKTFFKSNNKIFAHGKDPFFNAWQDTVQVNYFSPDAREFMFSQLRKVSQLCDGVRCDMAMLINNSVFADTWGKYFAGNEISFPTTEFWSDIIPKIKDDNKEFIFIAEAYWNKEFEMQLMGFDYTYDKKLLDRLKTEDVTEIRNHLLSDINFQKKLIRFLENHDEQRSSKVFSQEKIKAAIVMLFTLPGMKLIYDGQFEGRVTKLPVQLGREPEETVNESLQFFYTKVINISQTEAIQKGNWKLLQTLTAWEGNFTYKKILAWLWNKDDQTILVAVNYSNHPAQCRVKFDTKNYSGEFIIRDILNDVEYNRSVEEINNCGLYIDLKPYYSHIFLY